MSYWNGRTQVTLRDWFIFQDREDNTFFSFFSSSSLCPTCQAQTSCRPTRSVFASIWRWRLLTTSATRLVYSQIISRRRRDKRRSLWTRAVWTRTTGRLFSTFSWGPDGSRPTETACPRSRMERILSDLWSASMSFSSRIKDGEDVVGSLIIVLNQDQGWRRYRRIRDHVCFSVKKEKKPLRCSLYVGWKKNLCLETKLFAHTKNTFVEKKEKKREKERKKIHKKLHSERKQKNMNLVI